MFKDILVVLDDARASPYAMHLVSQFDSDITAAWSHQESAFAALSQAEVRFDMISDVKTAEENSVVCTRKFLDQAAAAGVRAHTLAPTGAETGTRRELSAWARLFDLVVIDQAGEEAQKSPRGGILSTLSRCGRPVLIAPHLHEASSPESVMVAWDGSIPAARALADAIPLLKRARLVEIVTVSEEFRKPVLPAGADIVQHLSRHAIFAKFTELPGELDVSGSLLSYAAEIGADLMIAGAYGHSPLVTELFGSTTGALLQSMTMPLFVSH